MGLTKVSGAKSDSSELMETLERKKIGDLVQTHQRLKRKIFDFYTIFDLTKDLNSLLDLSSLLDNILYTCITQLEVKGAAIILQRNLRSRKLDLVKTKGIQVKRRVCFNSDSALMDLLKQSQKPLLLSEIVKSLKADSADLLKLRILKAEVIVPLLIKEKIRGVLITTRKIPSRFFDEDDLEFLSILVNQAAVAVENAMLYQSEKDSYLELKKTQKQLIHTERLAALGQLSANLAHEVNNPLGIIKNYLTLLWRSLKEKDEKKKYVRSIKGEVDRISRIVRQLLEFHRPKKERLCKLDLVLLLNQVLDLVEDQFLHKGISITRDFPKKARPITGHPDQLKQVFLNLLMNSKDFLPQGGRIEVSLCQKKGWTRIEFADTGCGIPEENLVRIFDPFFTTKSADKGLGLGLWICYGIIAKHGGTISAENREKGGAWFVISLPPKKGNKE
jgi:signal transduction histidine kinase